MRRLIGNSGTPVDLTDTGSTTLIMEQSGDDGPNPCYIRIKMDGKFLKYTPPRPEQRTYKPMSRLIRRLRDWIESGEEGDFDLRQHIEDIMEKRSWEKR